MSQLVRRGPAGGGGRRRAPASWAKPHRFAWEGKETAREGEVEAREGEASALEVEARGGAAQEGKALRVSALEVVLPAATAAPRASGIQSLSDPHPPPLAS